MAFEALRAQDQRVADIGWRLAVYGRLYCPEALTPLSGIRFQALGQFGGRDANEAAAHFGLGQTPAVLVVAKGSGAERAQIARDDWIAEVDGASLAQRPGETGLAVVERAQRELARALWTGRARLLLVMRGALKKATISGDIGCRSDIELVPSAKLNAVADGRVVQLTTGVLEQTRDDDELAFVIAHEMAHNILRHAEKTGRKRDEEIEADLLGLKLMKAAGYDPMAAARFWTRFGKKTGAGIFSDGTHMRTRARVTFLAAEAAKIAQ